MDDCIDSFGEGKVFSTLDAYSNYWKMIIRQKDLHKTAFVPHSSTYQYIRMLSGVANATASFQRTLYVIFTK